MTDAGGGRLSDHGATELVVVNTDWRLEDAGSKTYGMCFVRVSEPYSHMNFKRGFSLPCPTHERCALFALILGMELVDTIPAVTAEPDFVVSTKHAWVHRTMVGRKVDGWADGNRWPKHVARMKGMLLRARDVMAGLPQRTTLVLIPRDEDDPSVVKLVGQREDTDVDAIVRKGGGRVEIDRALRDMRMRAVLIDELMVSGARGSRPRARGDKKKMMDTVKQQTVHGRAGVADGDEHRGGGGEVQPAKGPGAGAPEP